MKRGLKILIILLAVAAILFAAETGQSLFQQALTKERAEADPAGAIRLYERVVKEFGKDRRLAAEALFRIGECHLALGNAEARRTFERLVREYAEQTQQVEDARARLAALGQAGGLSHPPGITLRKAWVCPIGVVEGSPSPDGRYLSFPDWDTGDLAVRDLVTGQNRRLTAKGSWKDSDEFAEASAISGDGRQIAYAWYNKEKSYDLRVMGMDGSQRRVVFREKEVGYVQPYQWTVDGKQILAALQKSRGETRIALIPTAGGPARVLKTLVRYPSYASLSPDGRFLVYDAPGLGDGRERDIFLLSVEGGQEIPP